MEANQQNLSGQEIDLVERAKTDDQAFAALYDIYFLKIYYFILKRVGHKQTTEDIVSAVFIKVFTNIKKFQPRNRYSFSAWVYRLAANSLTDHYRRQSKEPQAGLEEIQEPADKSQDPSGAVDAEDEKKLVRRVLISLPAKDREILELKFFAEMGNQEIAETLGISANNAGVLLYRALKKFQKYYEIYAK